MPILSLVALFATSMPNAVVLKPVANMYSRPTDNAEVVSQAIYASNVAVLGRRGKWVRVRTADDYTGWMAPGALRPGRPYATEGRVVEVASLFAHIYREKDITKHRPVITVPFETRLEATAASDDDRWVPVRLPNGAAAWIQAGDVAFNPQPLDIPAMLGLAKRFIGLPYTWGGASSYGYDCSGFVQMLERRRGFRMPRDAQPQADWSGAVPVTRDQLQPGDLLYFGKSDKRITHTGMYLGDGQFINATTHESPTIHIDRLDDPHWSTILVAMRRVK